MSNTDIHFEWCQNLQTNQATLLRMLQLCKGLESEELSLNFTQCGAVELNPSGFHTAILEPVNSTPSKQQTALDTQFFTWHFSKTRQRINVSILSAELFHSNTFHSWPTVSDSTEHYQCKKGQLLEVLSFVLLCLTLPSSHIHC